MLAFMTLDTVNERPLMSCAVGYHGKLLLQAVFATIFLCNKHPPRERYDVRDIAQTVVRKSTW